jgi:hypothetical protein
VVVGRVWCFGRLYINGYKEEGNKRQVGFEGLLRY